MRFFLATNQPDRIRQFGLHRRKDRRVVDGPDSGEDPAPPRGPAKDDKARGREVEVPPQQLTAGAFQSPLLDYYTSLGGAALLASSQPPTAAFSRAVEPNR